MSDDLLQRKRIHLEHFAYKGPDHVYFLTVCTADRQPHFRHDRIAGIVAEDLDLRSFDEIRLFCYCIMPDHVHLLMALREDYGKSLQNWVAAFKRYTARVVNMMFEVSPLWQRNFFDHVIRKEESLIRVAEYILQNPVRKGIVRDWGEYPFCRLNEDQF